MSLTAVRLNLTSTLISTTELNLIFPKIGIENPWGELNEYFVENPIDSFVFSVALSGLPVKALNPIRSDSFLLIVPDSAFVAGVSSKIKLIKPSIPDVKRYTGNYKVSGKIYKINIPTQNIQEGKVFTLKLPIQKSVRNKSLSIGHWDVDELDAAPTYVDMLGYDAVIWFTGYSTSSLQFSQESQEHLADYLDAGGRLFLSGQRIHYLIDVYQGDQFWFYEDYLNAEFNTLLSSTSYNVDDVEGIPGDPLSDGMVFCMEGGDGANNQKYIEAMNASNYGAVCFRPSDHVDFNAGVRVNTGVYRAVYSAFSFESINSFADRVNVMTEVMTWLMDSTLQGDPVTAIVLDGVMGEDRWFTSDVTVTLNAMDDTGIQITRYSVNGGPWIDYEGPFTISDWGYHTIEYYSIDIDDNVEDTKTKSLKIDNILPSLVVSRDNYYKALRIYAETDDAQSGTWKAEFYVDDVLKYTDSYLPFYWNCLESSPYTVTVKAYDIAGNVIADWFDVPFSDPPVTTITLDGVEGNNSWYVSPVEITLTATDDTGVGKTYYSIDDGSWQEYSAPFVISDEDDDIKVEYYSTDTDSNDEAEQLVLLKIDSTDPTISLSKQIAQNKLKFLAKVSDKLSGVWKVEFYVDGVLDVTVLSEPFEYFWTGTGVHIVTAVVYDFAGNTAEVSLDTEKPPKGKKP